MEDSCITCHRELEGTLAEPVRLFANDVHREVGLSCSSCHGGDPTAVDMEKAKEPAKGFAGAPAFREIPALCGSCHASADFMKQYNPSLRIDQVAEYQTSVHGQLAAKGDTRVATCTSCHSVHDIRRANHPASPVHPLKVADTCGRCHSDSELMSGYGIPHSQVADYKTSMHARALYDKGDLSAPTCSDCHGNHGAVPPGLTSVANVCGNCHGTQRQLFEGSPHSETFEAMGLSACVTCHNNHAVLHADESMLAGENSVCQSCHESDAGTDSARQMAETIHALSQRIDLARQTVAAAERAGMEVSNAIYQLRQASENIIFARHEVHSLDLTRVAAAAEEGRKIAQASHEEGVRAFEELKFRRRGLYVSLVIIAFVIAGLAAWIRVIEKDKHES